MEKKVNRKIQPTDESWNCEYRSKEEVLQDLYERKSSVTHKPKYHSKRVKGIDNNGKHFNFRVMKSEFDDGSNCPLFWKFFDNIQTIIKPIKEVVSVDTGCILSTVEKKPNRVIERLHPYVSLYIGNSHIRITPHGDSIEISRVWVDPHLHGKGIGTALVELIMNGLWFLNDFKPPKVMLEVTGQVGTGENLQETPVSKQCSFFRKFGFRVVEDSKSTNYRRMVFKDYSMYQNRLKELLDEKKNEEEIEYLNVA